MSLTLSISNPNQNIDSVIIRRSAIPFDMEDLPAPLATLPGSPVIRYEDNDVGYGESFWYLTTVVRGSRIQHGIPTKLTCRPFTGPGGESILIGDSVFGYMGSCSIHELGIDPGQWGGGTSQAAEYQKFIYRGRIIYTIGLVIGNLAVIIANKRFNSGVESFGGNATSQNYGEVITVQGIRYAPRIAKLHDYDNPSTDITTYGSSINSIQRVGSSELIDLHSALVHEATPTLRRRLFSPGMITPTPNSIASCDFATPITAVRHLASPNAVADRATFGSTPATSTSITVMPVIELMEKS